MQILRSTFLLAAAITALLTGPALAKPTPIKPGHSFTEPATGLLFPRALLPVVDQLARLDLVVDRLEPIAGGGDPLPAKDLHRDGGACRLDLLSPVVKQSTNLSGDGSGDE